MMKILAFVFIRWVVHGISHVVGLGVSLVVWASVMGSVNISHRSDQMSWGSQISKRTLFVKILKWHHHHHSLTSSKEGTELPGKQKHDDENKLISVGGEEGTHVSCNPPPRNPLITRPKPPQFITRQKHRFCTGNVRVWKMNRVSTFWKNKSLKIMV